MKITREQEIDLDAWECGCILRHLAEAPDHLLRRELGQLNSHYLALGALVERARRAEVP